jgi:hypothetical protein
MHDITPQQRERPIKASSKQMLDDIFKRARISQRVRKEMEQKILKDAINPDILKGALVNFLISESLPLETVESPSLHALLQAAALILHPVRRTQYIRKNWKREWQKTAFASVKKLWETSYLNASTSGPTESPLHVREKECESERVKKLGQLLQSL